VAARRNRPAALKEAIAAHDIHSATSRGASAPSGQRYCRPIQPIESPRLLPASEDSALRSRTRRIYRHGVPNDNCASPLPRRMVRSLRSIGDLHPLNAHHYSTHQAKPSVPPKIVGHSSICGSTGSSLDPDVSGQTTELQDDSAAGDCYGIPYRVHPRH
jgi:hypothetical protein